MKNYIIAVVVIIVIIGGIIYFRGKDNVTVPGDTATGTDEVIVETGTSTGTTTGTTTAE